MFGKPVPDIARELIVLELYRQGKISSGKAAELLAVHSVRFATGYSLLRYDRRRVANGNRAGAKAAIGGRIRHDPITE
jgi:hypothetical protein